jgi:hypothetical protein
MNYAKSSSFILGVTITIVRHFLCTLTTNNRIKIIFTVINRIRKLPNLILYYGLLFFSAIDFAFPVVFLAAAFLAFIFLIFSYYNNKLAN